MKKVINILIPLLAGTLIFILYAFIHEGAHALFVIAFGGTLTEFDINILNGYPHVNWAGDIMAFKSAVIDIAGPLLPVVFWFGGLLFINKKRDLLIQKVYLFASIGVLASLIPNVIIPILFELGVDVKNEDIAKFTTKVEINGFIVSIAIAIIFVIGLLSIIKRINIKEALLYQVDIPLKSKRHYLWAITSSIILSVVLIVASINIINKSIGTSNFNVPAKYDYLVNIDLKQMNAGESQVYEFNLDEPMLYDFNVIGDTKETVRVKVIGSTRINELRTNEMEICSGKGQINANYCNWLLEKGNYKIYLTKEGDIGNIKIYISKRIPEENELAQFHDNTTILNGDIPKLEDEFKLVSKEGLSDYANKYIYEFSINQDKNIFFSIFLTTQKGKAIVKLVGKGIEEQLISEYQIRTDGRGVFLKKGIYNLIVSCSDCDGDIFLYVKGN